MTICLLWLCLAGAYCHLFTTRVNNSRTRIAVGSCRSFAVAKERPQCLSVSGIQLCDTQEVHRGIRDT